MSEFQIDPARLRALGEAKGGAMIDAATDALAHFKDAASIGSSFPQSMSSHQERLDTLLGTLADTAANAVQIAEDYRERMIATADGYEAIEEANRTGIDSVEI